MSARAHRGWIAIAILSLAANAALAVLLWRAHQNAIAAGRPKPVPTDRALAPYAAIGSFVAENSHIPDLKWNETQFEAFQAGLRASYEGSGLPLDDAARQLRDDINARVSKLVATEQPDPADEYFRTLREKENVKSTPSGLHYRITEEGFGEKPTGFSTVVVSFAGRLPDGTALPKLSQTRIKVRVADLLPGLGEGVCLLTVGGKALVYLPAKLSFGDHEWPPEVPKGAPIAFFLELHEVVHDTAKP